MYLNIIIPYECRRTIRCVNSMHVKQALPCQKRASALLATARNLVDRARLAAASSLTHDTRPRGLQVHQYGPRYRVLYHRPTPPSGVRLTLLHGRVCGLPQPAHRHPQAGAGNEPQRRGRVQPALCAALVPAGTFFQIFVPCVGCWLSSGVDPALSDGSARCQRCVCCMSRAANKTDATSRRH